MTIHKAILHDRGVLRVAGEDAVGFLQGLLTNDVEGLAVGAARYAALLSPQGKILFDFLALRIPAESGTAFLIDCPAAQAADLAKRLGFYKLRAKVAVKDESADHDVLAIWGEETATLAEIAVGPAPPMTAADVDPAAFTYRDPRDPRLGFRAIAPRSAVAAADSDAFAYQAHRIRLGVPQGGVDFAYADIFPHDANLDLLHGVDFKKGCYVGQEVVSRMHHRGEPRKRIVRMALAGDAPAPGAAVLAGETPVGAIGSAAGEMALAIVRLDRVEEAIAAGKGLTAGGIGVQIDVAN